LPRLEIGHYLSSGRLSDTFSANLNSHHVVIKLVDLESFTSSGEPDEYDLCSAVYAISNEMSLYWTHLESLQGAVVPRLFEVCVGQTDGMRDVFMMVFEDVGEAISVDWKGIPSFMRYVFMTKSITLASLPVPFFSVC